jgi:hypothetical protein
MAFFLNLHSHEAEYTGGRHSAGHDQDYDLYLLPTFAGTLFDSEQTYGFGSSPSNNSFVDKSQRVTVSCRNCEKETKPKVVILNSVHEYCCRMKLVAGGGGDCSSLHRRMNTIEISPRSRPFVVTFVCGSPPETFAFMSKSEHLTCYTGRRKSKRAGLMV